MKKRTKILLGVIAGVLVLALGACGFAGNYFFDYALVRSEDGVGGADRDVSVETGVQADVGREEANRAEADAQTAAWLETVRQEEVSLLSEDGLRLAGTCYHPEEDSHRWVIAVHGYTSSQESMRNIARHYVEKGFHALTPDLRAHGESEGRYIGMGWLDRKDILLWIGQILENDPQAQIALHGVSMGAATVMMVSGEESLPENVKVIVEDCGYTDVSSVFTSELKLRFGLPPFPLINSLSVVCRLRAGYFTGEASALKQVEKSHTPTLFIHGDADDFIPVEMVSELYDACAADKEKLIVHGAGHAASCDVDPDAYYSAVFDFVESYIPAA
ncbi:MAG TPA: alpha/beta hydrolase [Firmicutes bacterium]|nr:alpha/beta hydrolase [Bacillota bacterium]